MATRFNVNTDCAQTGPWDSVVCEELLDSASTLELEPFGVDVEAGAEARNQMIKLVGQRWKYPDTR